MSRTAAASIQKPIRDNSAGRGIVGVGRLAALHFGPELMALIQQRRALAARKVAP